MKILKILILVLCFSGRYTSANATTINTGNNEQIFKDTTTINLVNNLPSGKTVGIYYENKYNLLMAYPTLINSNNRRGSILKISVTKPTFFHTFENGRDYFYIKPGEEIEVGLDDSGNLLLIDGKDSVRNHELAFFQNLNRSVPLPRENNVVIHSVIEFNQLNDQYLLWYSKAKDFFKNYIKDKNISPEFRYVAQKSIYYQYISLLLNVNRISFSNPHILEQTFLKDFPFCDSCAFFPTYIGAVYCYINTFAKRDNSLSRFASTYDVANTKLPGKLKEQMLFRLLSQNLRSMVGNAEYKMRLDSFCVKYGQDSLCTFLNEIYSKKLLAKMSLKKGGLNELMLCANGNMISLQNVLDQSRGKVVILDFWASYCGPCLQQIAFSHQLQKKFKDNPVRFIYLSQDMAKSDWVNSMKNYGLNNVADNYLMFLDAHSTITKFYKIRQIPKYVVYGKDGKLISSNAPYPSDPALEKIIRDNL